MLVAGPALLFESSASISELKIKAQLARQKVSTIFGGAWERENKGPVNFRIGKSNQSPDLNTYSAGAQKY